MKLIVGFNLSSYSHCTSYTRLTTDTGNCCRACGWPFIESTNIVISNIAGYFQGETIIPKKIFVHDSPCLKLLLHLSKFHRGDFHNWSSNCENSHSTILFTIIDLPT